MAHGLKFRNRYSKVFLLCFVTCLPLAILIIPLSSAVGDWLHHPELPEQILKYDLSFLLILLVLTIMATLLLEIQARRDT